MITYDDDDQIGLFSAILGGSKKKEKPKGTGEQLDNPLSEMNKFDKSMVNYKMNQKDPLMPDGWNDRSINFEDEIKRTSW